MELLSVNQTAYTVLRLLGKGKGGYSYLVSDGFARYVLKQIHHEPCSYYNFGDKLAAELSAYKRLSHVGIPMPSLLDVDEAHERILKEYIEGDTIYDLVLRNEMRQEYFDQIHAMCALLYPAGLNIDYFPTNFVVRGGILYYIDYECNDYHPQWDFETWGAAYWSRTDVFLAHVQETESSTTNPHP